MFKDLLFSVTVDDVIFIFGNESYLNPSSRRLYNFLDWFSESDLYVFLSDSSGQTDHFRGFMIGMSLLAHVAIRLDKLEEWQDFLDQISWEIAHLQLYRDHDKDSIYDLMIASDTDSFHVIFELVRARSTFFFSGVFDLFQILYSFEALRNEVEGEIISKTLPDAEEGELIEEPEDWPELIG